MNPGDKLLIVQCSNDIAAAELDAVRACVGMHGLEVIHVNLCKNDDLVALTTGKCFHLAYICGHGNITRLCNELGNCITWDQMAMSFCNSACMAENAVIFCATCRGGLKTVAQSFFKNCSNVEYVIGPRADIYPATLTLAFHVFMFNKIFRRSDSETAIDITSSATGFKFDAHSRQALMDNAHMEAA
jgi:hypothetical protein